jgi:gluconolactonase
MVFASDLKAPEGPVLLEDGSWLAVEMAADPGCVTHIEADGKTKQIVAKTGRPNGLAVDKNGTIWVAESKNPSLLRLRMDGSCEVFLTECDGEPFEWPNDLAFGPDGALYMTDSGILSDVLMPGGELRDDYLELSMDGRVYRIDVDTKEITKIDSGIQFTNGIVFGPDSSLYVNETITGMVYRYSWQNGAPGEREEFGNVIVPEWPGGWVGPDGMKFGQDENLYVTVFMQGDVTVLDKKGEVLKRIKTRGSKPTNCAFGPPGSKKLYVTEVELGNLEVLDVDTDGFPLYSG